MATRTTATVWTNTTDADFRAWGSWVSGSFSAFGWTLAFQSFATGTNWTDVLKPASGSTAAVTEVWAMNDVLQATVPLFVKIEYGGSSAATTPGVRITVASGHAGGGTLSGIFRTGNWSSIAANTNIMNHYASGENNRIVLAMAVSGVSWSGVQTLVLSIERRRDGTGAVTGAGFQFLWKLGNFDKLTEAVVNGAVVPGNTNLIPFPGAAPSTSISAAGITPVLPAMFAVGTPEIGTNVMFVDTAQFTAGATLTATVLGGSRTYLSTQSTDIGAAPSSPANYKLAIRFD